MSFYEVIRLIRSKVIKGRARIVKDRFYSFLIPWFSDGAWALATTAAPLLALRFGADAMILGLMGFAAHATRVPLCLTLGRASDRVGRTRIAVPAICIAAAGMVGLGLSWGIVSVGVFYWLLAACAGAFYPPLQALVGDVSRRGQLRKNLGAFNLGWCTGGAVAALAAGWLVFISLPLVAYSGAGAALVAAGLIIAWRSRPADHAEESPGAFPDYSGSLLLIARMGHFTGFFGYSVIRNVFPKLGQDLGWSEPTIAKVVAIVLVGQAVGMVAAGFSSWWRGKLWPQLGAQGAMVVAGCGIAVVSSPVLLGSCFLAIGFALSVAYSGALYYSLSSRKDRGRNTGIHETLVSAGYTTGSLIGGFAAQFVAPRAPYLVLAFLAAACMVWTVSLTHRPKRVQIP